MAFRTALLLAILSLYGCHGHLQQGVPGGSGLGHGPPVENPLFVPVTDPELVWTQVLDALDNYFKVHREERVRLVGDVLLEGRLETFPTDGSTLLEPWRSDSTHGYEKWHATLQSIRRHAVVRVIPAAGGFLIELIVSKELEDLSQPEHATVDRTTFRYDGTLVRREDEPAAADGITLGWIPLGRDFSLEQQILRDLRSRLVP